MFGRENKIGLATSSTVERAYINALERLEDLMQYKIVPAQAKDSWVLFDGSLEVFIIYLSLNRSELEYLYVETTRRYMLFEGGSLTGNYIDYVDMYRANTNKNMGDAEMELGDGYGIEAFSIFANIGGVMVGVNINSELAAIMKTVKSDSSLWSKEKILALLVSNIESENTGDNVYPFSSA
jgi:hypothetical protein